MPGEAYTPGQTYHTRCQLHSSLAYKLSYFLGRRKISCCLAIVSLEVRKMCRWHRTPQSYQAPSGGKRKQFRRWYRPYRDTNNNMVQADK